MIWWYTHSMSGMGHVVRSDLQWGDVVWRLTVVGSTT
jgi:hypothetical protein